MWVRVCYTKREKVKLESRYTTVAMVINEIHMSLTLSLLVWEKRVIMGVCGGENTRVRQRKERQEFLSETSLAEAPRQLFYIWINDAFLHLTRTEVGGGGCSEGGQ